MKDMLLSEAKKICEEKHIYDTSCEGCPVMDICVNNVDVWTIDEQEEDVCQKN